MRKFGKIAVLSIAPLLGLVACYFLFAEGKILFGGEWTAYSDTAGGFFIAFLRFFLALFALAMAVLPFIAFLGKKRPLLNLYLYAGTIALVFVGIVIGHWASEIISIVIRLLPAFYFLGMLFYWLGNDKKKSSES